LSNALFRTLATAAVTLSLAAALTPAHAAGRFIIDEENDSIGSFGDRHYTQGLRLAYLSDRLAPSDGWNAPFSWLSSVAPVFGDSPQSRRIDFSAGQSMFTPANLRLVNPDPTDRPYAGWLFAGASLLQQSALSNGNGHMLETFDMQLGVVGPAALAHQAQDLIHDLISDRDALGWSYQLKNEPGVVLSYERKWRLEHPLGDGFGIDVIPSLGATVGNVLTYGEAGAMLRFGQNTQVDYGPGHIQPGRSGSDWFDDSAIGPNAFGWYLFAGVQGRVVGRNVFLDGNTFTTSRGVDKKPFVADITGGAALYWSHRIKLDISFTQRSREYETQPQYDRFGVVTISFGL
jgi:lipid A 3-O-deacylase